MLLIRFHQKLLLLVLLHHRFDSGAKTSFPPTLMNLSFALGNTTSFDFHGHPPNCVRSKSWNALRSSSFVFMTIGPEDRIGSPIGRPWRIKNAHLFLPLLLLLLLLSLSLILSWLWLSFVHFTVNDCDASSSHPVLFWIFSRPLIIISNRRWSQPK